MLNYYNYQFITNLEINLVSVDLQRKLVDKLSKDSET